MTRTLTTAQAADRLGVSVRRVQALATAGRLKGEKHGRDWFFTETDVKRFKPLPPGWQKGRKRK